MNLPLFTTNFGKCETPLELSDFCVYDAPHGFSYILVNVSHDDGSGGAGGAGSHDGDGGGSGRDDDGGGGGGGSRS